MLSLQFQFQDGTCERYIRTELGWNWSWVQAVMPLSLTLALIAVGPLLTWMRMDHKRVCSSRLYRNYTLVAGVLFWAPILCFILGVWWTARREVCARLDAPDDYVQYIFIGFGLALVLSFLLGGAAEAVQMEFGLYWICYDCFCCNNCSCPTASGYRAPSASNNRPCLIPMERRDYSLSTSVPAYRPAVYNDSITGQPFILGGPTLYP